ncbi:hypothetical protein DWF00_22700 [Bosea caraganae]|uniref:Lipoprotein n=1 Tax=Bosea caraganae TaxID=2763117 RepID=A0A370L1M5_9HYPH|nr:hypothetical protein DWE98_20765 [Bosea caraganae]RDJ23437.1 hypothetical protein DWF00_22700 [Bosea caraganae]
MGAVSRFRAVAPLASLLLALGCTVLGSATPALSEVRFGRNVRVGGHDFSNRTYDRNNRAIIHLYRREPRNAGCAWHADGRGGRVQICHLRRKSR